MLTASNRKNEIMLPGAPDDRRGQLFNVHDFALADLQPAEMWDRMVTAAVRERCTDIHLTCQKNGLHADVRMDGKLCSQGVLPMEIGRHLVNHIKVLADLDVAERRRPQDGHIGLDIDGRPIDLRISVLPTNHGEDLAVRLFDRELSILELEQLGLLDRQLRDIASLVENCNGLVLVTGSTGAGKTTTLYSLLKRLADGSRKIVTIEDPVEYDLPGINQAPVHTKLGVDYSVLLRSVLRQDPNVIMIGEIRDAETAQTVVRAANSGRLVLTTSHAPQAAAAIETLISLGAHPHFVARAFRGVIAQTLVRKVCTACAVRLEETADAKLLEDVQSLLGPGEHPALSIGRGCPQCRFTGYRGRTGIFEVLTANERVREMIGHNVSPREIYAYATQHKMLTIAQAGKLAVLRGQTTIEELLQNLSEIWMGETA